MPARVFDFLFLNKGVGAYPVVSVKFAGELNRCAVADGRQFVERDVSGNVLLDIVLDQPGMSAVSSIRTSSLQISWLRRQAVAYG